jgi:hypothetical protein
VTKFTEHLDKVRTGLERANNAFNEAVGSYDRMVRPSGERLLRLSGQPESESPPELTPIETTLRLTQNSPAEP